MKIWFCLCLLLFVATSRAEGVGRHEGARELWLSGDGKIAFSSGENGARVWDVVGKRELAPLPAQAGRVIAVAEDGRRVLCRRSERKAQRELGDLTLWWRPRGVWQRGTQVRGAGAGPLLDATFAGREVVLLWEKSIERRGASGRLRRTIRLKELRWQVSWGTLSPDGRRAVASGEVGEQLTAFIYNASTGRPLTRITLNAFNSYSGWKFSPNAQVVGALVGEPVGPWNPDDGPQPTQWTRILWDISTGAELSNSLDLSLAFWPHSKHNFLVQSQSKASSEFGLTNISTEKTLPFPFAQPWEEHAVTQLRFSRNGKVLVALDAKGNIWFERQQAAI